MKEITYEVLQKANECIKTIGIERKDKNGNTTTKNYAEVSQRVKAFRMVYPKGSIVTELIYNNDGFCIFKATIFDEEKNILATGTAKESENSSYINKTSYIENCETSAVGRALGMCGFGIDVSIASADDMQKIENKDVSENKNDRLQKLSKLKELVQITNADYEKILKYYQKDSDTKMTLKEIEEAIENLEKRAK